MSVMEKKDHTHPNPKVRMTALGKVDDPEVLVEVACSDDSPRVRLTAVSRLTDDPHLEKVARHAESLDVRLVAVERIFSQGVVADLLKVPEDVELIGMCFSRITDRRIIESIAEDPDYSPTVRRMAVEFYADESYLAEAAEAAEAEPVRKTDKAVEAFIEAYGGGLHGVRAIGRLVEYLCSALGSANPKLVECATAELVTLKDPDLVDSIIRALDNENLREPLREVLRRIDTPEARAVLGDQPSDA